MDEPLSPGFGRALASMDSQIIDPTPGVGIPETSAAKASLAIGRYAQDRVTEPPGAYVKTSEASAQQGAGDGSGAPKNSTANGGGDK